MKKDKSKTSEALLEAYFDAKGIIKRRHSTMAADMDAFIVQRNKEYAVEMKTADLASRLAWHHEYIDTRGKSGIHCDDFMNERHPYGDFRGARLYGSLFNGADLRGADFTGADLRAVNFSGADLTGAKGFSAETLKQTKMFLNAFLPPELVEMPEFLSIIQKEFEDGLTLRHWSQPYRPYIAKEGDAYRLMGGTWRPGAG